MCIGPGQTFSRLSSLSPLFSHVEYMYLFFFFFSLWETWFFCSRDHIYALQLHQVLNFIGCICYAKARRLHSLKISKGYNLLFSFLCHPICFSLLVFNFLGFCWCSWGSTTPLLVAKVDRVQFRIPGQEYVMEIPYSGTAAPGCSSAFGASGLDQ